MKRKAGLILIILGLALILGAAGWAGYNLWDENRAKESSEKALNQLIERLPEMILTEEKETKDPVAELGTPATEVVYPDYVLDPTMEMPVQEIDGHEYVGILSIPTLDMELPILSAWSYEGASISPCRYSGSAYLDDLVIAAHNHRAHFGPLLNDIRLEDAVTFTDVDGNVFSYRVVEFQVVEPTQIDEMITGEWDLTLFTCNPGMLTRLAVRCEKVE